MKKITLFITLIAFTFGFSQSIPVTFDVGISASNWYADAGLTSATVEDIVGDNPDHGNVGKIVSSSGGNPWQNAQLLLEDNYIDLTTNKVITLDVYSNNPQNFLLKLEGSLNGGGITEKGFSHSGNGWETIEVDFNSPNGTNPVPNDQYRKFIIFPCYNTEADYWGPGAFDSTVYIDNFSGTVGDAYTPPLPVDLPFDFETSPVTSDFTGFDGGSATVEAVAAPQSTGNTSTNLLKIVRNGGAAWAGVFTVVDTPLDFSTNSTITARIWTDAPIGTTIMFKTEQDTNPANNSGEKNVVTTVTGGWEDLVFDFSGVTNANQNKLVLIPANGTVGDGTATSTFYIDDIAQAAPENPSITTTVTVDVSESPGGVNIQSNQNGWAEAAAVDNGDGTYSYTFENVAAGTVIEYKWILYTSATPTFEDLIPLVGGGGVDNDLAANLPTNETILTDYANYCNRTITASTTDVVAQTYFFNSFRQPGVDYPELVVTAPAGENLVIDYSSNGWSEFHGPGAVDNGDGTHTVLVDPSSAFQYKWVNTTTGVTEDLLACDNNDPSIDTDNSTYANRVHVAGEDESDTFGSCPIPDGPSTSAPIPPTRDASDVFSLLSDAYTNQTAGVNAFAGASIEDFVIGGTDNTLKVTAPSPGGGYQYVFGIPNGVDLSAFTHMHIDYYAMGEVVGGEVLQTFLQQFAGDGAFQHNIINTAAVTTTASWVSIDVEISTMGSGELSRDNIGQIQMVLAGPAYGPVFLDNIYFYREATQGLDDNVFNTVKMFPNPAKDTVQFSVNSNENLDIEIFDMLGKSVLRVNDVQNEVNISDLNSGLYFVQMTLGTQQATKKLIVN